jgi:hypothetical protein
MQTPNGIHKKTPGRKRSICVKILSGVLFANVFEAYTTVTTFNIRCRIKQMGGAYTFNTIGFGATIPAFDNRFI